MKSFRTLATLAALLLAAPALAQPYVFGGYSSVDSHAGVTVGGGFNFGKHIGAEASYTKPEKFMSDVQAIPGTPFTGSSDTEVKGSMATLAAIGKYPMNDRWEIIGKLSANYIDADFRQHVVVPGSDTTTTRNTKDWAVGYGIGIGLGAAKGFGARLMYERIGKTDELEAFDHVQLQGIYRF